MRHYRMGHFLVCLAAATAFIASLPAVAAGSPRTQYLDELTSIFTHTQGWGTLGVNTTAHATGMTPMQLRIADREYERGIGHHAPGEIVLPLNGNYLSFTAEVGVQWQGGSRGSVLFTVWVDGVKRFESGIMTDSDAAIPVAVDLRGAQELRLVASDAEDGIACDMANWADAKVIHFSCFPDIGAAMFSLDGVPLDTPVEMEGNFAQVGDADGSQFVFNRHLGVCLAFVQPGKTATISIPLWNITCPFSVHVEWKPAGHLAGDISLMLESGADVRSPIHGDALTMSLDSDGTLAEDVLHLVISADEQARTALEVYCLRLTADDQATDMDFLPRHHANAPLRTPQALPLPVEFEISLIEWDWRMQDGIGAGNTRNSYEDAIRLTLARGDAMIATLTAQEKAPPAEIRALWREQHQQFDDLCNADFAHDAPEWENLWLVVNTVRRRIMMKGYMDQITPLLFVKQAPGVFSHQLTQYYGRYARPGGGVFMLEHPGWSMRTRQLGEGLLPEGSYMQPELTHDGERILFAFCPMDAAPEDMFNGHWGRHYHVYEMDREGAYVRRLTHGDHDDFSPVELPNGQIMFISTRRGGWHRCGGIGCPVYTLTLMEADGGNIRTISYHETQEWDPAVLNDGRIIYTRWDYIDRHAIHYQQLWTVHPDGTGPVAFYGNHTLNPVGVWEARAVPGSHKVMATAAAHHAMTAGSIILIDQNVGVDDLEPITRLTPHAVFPESEDVLLPAWRSAAPCDPPERTPEMERWPMQCYRSPWPLSEDVFLAAYSFDPLMGEPNPNLANMFGIYLVDTHGNKELLYRDLNISSLWPIPLRPRDPAPALPSTLTDGAPDTGTYYLQDVYESAQPWPEDTRITDLRIIQVLPKSTPVAHDPPLGLAFASPGKQVLGTVPVEEDGSAYFTAPARLPLSIQALDATGQAVQIMRSVTYLQPGENASCVGCHEPRLGTPAAPAEKAVALRRTPSQIQPGPDGSRPFSYPILVQPVLDKHCVRCHSGDDAKGPEGQDAIRLTGALEGQFTESYNTLAPRVAFAEWGKGASLADNSEPTTQPGFFGAVGSSLMHLLSSGHQEVELDGDDWERLITWMDNNGLFYGTFNFEDQKVQQRGERIAGPDIE